MELGIRGHLIGLLAVLWTGGVFTAMVMYEILPFWASLAVWGAGIVGLLCALLALARHEDRQSPSPISRALVSLIYGSFAVALTIKMAGYVKEGYYSYLAALIFVGMALYAAFDQARRAVSEVKNAPLKK